MAQSWFTINFRPIISSRWSRSPLGSFVLIGWIRIMLIQAIVAATSIIVSSTSMKLTIQSKVHLCDFILLNETCTYLVLFDLQHKKRSMVLSLKTNQTSSKGMFKIMGSVALLFYYYVKRWPILNFWIRSTQILGEYLLHDVDEADLSLWLVESEWTVQSMSTLL